MQAGDHFGRTYATLADQRIALDGLASEAKAAGHGDTQDVPLRSSDQDRHAGSTLQFERD